MELLSTLASIAASLVGFTGLLTAFRAGTDALDANDVTNIRILLIFSVSALVFALVPIAVITFDADGTWFRRLTGLFGAYFIFWSIQSPRWMKAHAVRPRNPKLYWSMIMTLSLVGVLIASGAVFAAQPLAIYTLGVLWCLLTAIVVFVVQIFQMLPIAPRGGKHR